MQVDSDQWIHINEDGIRWIENYELVNMSGPDDDDDTAQVAARLPLLSFRWIQMWIQMKSDGIGWIQMMNSGGF